MVNWEARVHTNSALQLPTKSVHGQEHQHQHHTSKLIMAIKCDKHWWGVYTCTTLELNMLVLILNMLCCEIVAYCRSAKWTTSWGVTYSHASKGNWWGSWISNWWGRFGFKSRIKHYLGTPSTTVTMVNQNKIINNHNNHHITNHVKKNNIHNKHYNDTSTVNNSICRSTISTSK